MWWVGSENVFVKSNQFILTISTQKKPYGFGTTRGWVNDDRMYIFLNWIFNYLDCQLNICIQACRITFFVRLFSGRHPQGDRNALSWRASCLLPTPRSDMWWNKIAECNICSCCSASVSWRPDMEEKWVSQDPAWSLQPINSLLSFHIHCPVSK